MQSYLDSLAALPEGLLPVPRATAEDLIRHAHEVLLRTILGVEKRDLPTEEALALQELGLQLELVATSDVITDRQTRQDALYVTAVIFEFLGTLHVTSATEPLPRVLRSTPANLLLRSAVLYSLGEFEASAVVVAKRLWRHAESVFSSMAESREPALRIASHALLAIVAFLGRDFTTLRRHVARGQAEVVLLRDQVRNGRTGVSRDLRAAGTLLGIADACRNVADYMTYGLDQLYGRGTELFRQIGRTTTDADDAFLKWLASRCLLVSDRMRDRSVFQMLHRDTLPGEYARLLAGEGIFELWSSQKDAIDAGLLEPRMSAVVSLPTGTGKTLVAEAFIIRVLNERQDAWGVYLVPTRALASEAEDSLRRRLPGLGHKVRSFLLGTEADVVLDEEAALITQARSVTVLTPEKLDLYFRVRPDLLRDCGFCVVDEAHNIGRGYRGALLENLLTRLLVLNGEVRFLLLSPFISNITQVADWLGQGTSQCRSQWQPTRQLKGLARLHGGRYRTRHGTYRASGGVVFVRRPEDAARQRLFLPGLFEVRFDKKGKLSSGAPEHATEIAKKFANAPGTVLAFFVQPASAEKCAREVAKERKPLDLTLGRRRLSEHVADLVGPQHELVEMIVRGVAYHHGRLPRDLRVAIERGIRDDLLRFVAATSTLAEGVNTPATTVIIAGTSRYDVERGASEALDVREFLNMAGRAGRPLRETEGQIILVPQGLLQSNVGLARKYFFPSDEALELQSAFEQLEAALATPGDDEPRLSLRQQAMVLALVAAGIASEEEVSRFFGRTFAAVLGRYPREQVSGGAWRFIRGRGAQWDPETYRLLASTGLSADGAEALYGRISEAVEGFPSIFESVALWGEEGELWLRDFLGLLESVPDLHTAQFGPGLQFPHARVLQKWMGFAPYTELAWDGVFQDKVERVVDYIGLHADLFAWGAGATYLVARRALEERGRAIDRTLAVLPLFLRFGVGNIAASLLCLVGLTSRAAAEILSDEYLRTHPVEEAGISALQEWIRQVDEDGVGRLFGDDLRAQAEDVIAVFGLGGERRRRRRVRIQIHVPEEAGQEAFAAGSMVLINWIAPGEGATAIGLIDQTRVDIGAREVAALREITRHFDQALIGTVVIREARTAEVEVHGQARDLA